MSSPTAATPAFPLFEAVFHLVKQMPLTDSKVSIRYDTKSVTVSGGKPSPEVLSALCMMGFVAGPAGLTYTTPTGF